MPLEFAKVYIASLDVGKAPASLIAKKTKIPRSTCYGILEELIKFGLVSSVKEETKKIFYPSSPEQLDFLLTQKQTDLTQSVKVFKKGFSSLMAAYSAHQSKFPKVRFHEGEFGLKTVYFDSLQSKEILVICQGSPDIQTSLKDDPDYLKDYIKACSTRNQKSREILDDTPACREYRDKYNSKQNKILLVPFKPKKDFGHVDKHIYGDKVAYISHDNLVGVIIEDATIAAHERAQFEALWNFYSKN